MSQEHVEVVRRILDAWADGDFGGGVEGLDQHVLFAVSNDFPEAGVLVGPAAIGKYMRTFLENWEHYTIEATRIDSVGDTVLAHVLQHGHGRDGLAVEVPSFVLFTFRGGRIVRLEWLRHESEALEAVGLLEPGAPDSS
jgi:ketosteroid isomerase-like protein